MKTLKCISVFILAIILQAGHLPVEAAESYNKFSFGFHGGTLTGFTDVKKHGLLPSSDEVTFGGGLMLNYHMSPVLTLQGSFFYGDLMGIYPPDNLEFQSELMEGTFRARTSINTLLVPHSRLNQYVNLYAFVGAGVVAYRSRLWDGGVLQQPMYGYEFDPNWVLDKTSPEIELAVPFGMGVNVKLSDRIDLGIETGFRYTSSDRLDARVVPGSRADMYNYTSVGLTFRLGRNTNSKDWASPARTMYPGDIDRLDRLSERVERAERDVTTVKEKQEELELREPEVVDVDVDADLDAIRREIDALAEQQTDLGRRTTQIFGALEDITEQIIRLETERPEIPVRPEDPEVPRPDVFYSVQVMASKENVSVAAAQEYLGVNTDMERLYIDGWYKFVSGRFHNLEDAILHMQRIWNRGVRDAFVVKYENGSLRPR